MKWVYAATTVMLLVVVAIIGPSFLRKDEATDPPPAAQHSQSSLVDWVQPESLTKTVQMLAAMSEMRDRIAGYPDLHKIVLTIRDGPPLEIWKVDDQMCVPRDDELPPTIEITRTDGTQVQASQTVPQQATLLDDGGCEVTVDVSVEDETVYYLSIKLAGRDNPKSTAVVREGTSQEVTLDR